MDFELTERQRSVVTRAAEFAREHLSAPADARDAEGAFAADLWARCGEQKIQGWPVPAEYGGGGLDPLETALALEALGQHCDDNGLVFSIGAHLCVVNIAVWKFGSEEQKRRYLPQLSDGSFIGAGAMTEPGAGSDPAAMQTTATADGDHFVLRGRKTHITNAPLAHLFLVYAITDASRGYQGGVSTFLIARDTPGLTVTPATPTMGLRTARLGGLELDDVRVPASALLGKSGSGRAIFSTSMEWERVMIFAAHVGTMQRLLDSSVTFAKTRVQSGTAIGKHQVVAHRLADMKIRLEAARMLVYKAASQIDRSRSASLDASIAKVFASEAYVALANDAILTRGALGFLTGPWERIARDATAAPIYSGTNDIQRKIIAKWLGL